MDRRALESMVAGLESTQREFKVTTGQLKPALKTVCAMLNGRGGFVLFGVRDSGQIVGQSVTPRTLEEVSHEIRKMEPPALVDIETIEIGAQKSVIVLSVPGGGGPFTYDGRPYTRTGPTTSVMPQGEYERLILERMHGSRRWENQPALGVSVGDLDQAEITRTLEEAIRRQRLADPGVRDPVEVLTGLGLLHDGHLLNAAVVLFGREHAFLPNYPQCVLRMARFRGSDKTEFLDNRQEQGNAFDLFVRAQRFLRDHLPVAGRIVPNLFERIDDPLYPTAALREALANALCHRDYSIGGGSVSIAIYDDRLEIASTGSLHFGLTVEALMKPHASRPWNPLIAGAFYRRGIIERWGRGTLRMRELTVEAGLAPPEIEATSDDVVVRFRPTSYVPPTRISRDLSSLQRELLTILSRQGPCSLSEIQRSLSTQAADRTVQENLALLRQLDLIDSISRGRGARWMLKGINA